MAGYSDVRIAFADLLPNIATYVFMAFVLFVNGVEIRVQSNSHKH